MEATAPLKFRTSVLLYLAVAFAAFFPSLALNQSYFANDLLYQFAPFRLFLKQQLAQGHFPLWNPYLFGGQPFFANPNAMMCYPLTYLTLLFPIAYGLGVFFFLHMFLAAAGMHFWLKSLRLSENACRMGSLVFALSGVFWWEIIHLQILAAYALFPWLMGSLERWLKDWKTGWAFLAGLFFALVFCCGGFQSTTGVFYTALCYFLARLALQGRTPEGSAPSPFPWKKVGVALLFALWGGLPLLTHLVPSEEFSRFSNRRDPGQTYDNFNGTFSMVPSTTYEFLFPTLGLPAGQTIESAIQVITDQKNIGNDFLGDFGYIGIWAPLLFFWAFQRKEKKFLAFLLGMGALSILTAWGRYTPLHRLLCAVLPGVDLSRAPFRFLQTYVLFGAVLAAYGFQALERRFQEKAGSSGFFFPAAIYASVLFLASLVRPGETWREMLALLVGMAGLALWGLTESWKSLGRWLFQAALVLPLLLTGWNGFSVGPPSNFDYGSNFPPFAALSGHGDVGRYYFNQDLAYPLRAEPPGLGGEPSTYQAPLPENAVLPLGIRDIGGYSPIVLKRTEALRKLPPSTYFNLMAVRGILAGQALGTSSDLIDQPMGPDHLYLFKSPPPFAVAPEQTKVMGGDDQVLEALKRPGFNPQQEVYLSDPLPPALASKPSGPNPGFSYSLSRDGVDDQSFKIHMDAGGLAAFSEIAFPGWRARVDGQPADLLTADYAFRALYVPPGDHQVEFTFQPRWWTPLRILLLLWIISAGLYGFSFLRKKPSLDPAKA